ncbi:hypothetical protein CVT25_008994 [Psilocybe cyanescens]|uniref:Uncharacterized protein n=1 Tax=Psilocybe cyanescens TaxID=93625 RepID=A0A409XND8_PSICY|nr:hypothetical protein CVT25_008994 [Psilocybe cyanescens]
MSAVNSESQPISGSALSPELPLSGPAVPLPLGSSVRPPSTRPRPPNPPLSKDFSILKVETKQVSGEALPADVRAYLAPGVQMLLGSRRVMRCTLFEATKTNNTSTLPYYGLVQPEKEDITLLMSRLHGIQAIYKKAGSVDEPMLMDHEVPTVTTVSFMHLIMDNDVLVDHLERDRRRVRALEARQAELQRPQRAPPPPPYESHGFEPVHSYFKRKREDDEEFDRRAEKRAKADHTNSNISFYIMGIATGVAFKYLL